MIKLTDEMPDAGPLSEATLMRFVDGDLPPREHAFVAELIAAHPEVSNSVNAYRFTKEDLPGAYQTALQVPTELINRWLPEPTATGRVTRLGARSVLSNWRPLAMAASVAAMIAGTAGWLLHEAAHPDLAALLGTVPPSMQRALNETLTGELAQLGGAVAIRPMSTFPSLERHWCRQYILSDGSNVGTAGLACRLGASWRIVAQSTSKRRPSPALAGEKAVGVPAAGAGDDVVASYRDQIMGGNVLTKEDEERLIRKERWGREP
jgi:hypothetical protein